MTTRTVTRLSVPPRSVLDVTRDLLDVPGVVMVTLGTGRSLTIELDSDVIVPVTCVVCDDRGCEHCPAVGAVA